jgi:hypothetical protein
MNSVFSIRHDINHRSSLPKFGISENQSIEIPEFIPGLPLLQNGNNWCNNTGEETNGAHMLKTSFHSPEERQKSKSLNIKHYHQSL